MKIGFDAKRAAQNRTGLGNYSRFVLRILSEQHLENEYHLFMPKRHKTPFLHEIPTLKSLHCHFPVTPLAQRLASLWRVWGMGSDLRREGIEVFHGLSNELPLTIRKAGCRSVVTIHDLIFLRYPQYYRPIDRIIYNYKFRRACINADKIIAVSEYTKQEIIHFYGIAPDKIEVVYQGCDRIFAQQPSQQQMDEVKALYHLPQRFLLYVGSIEERKNLMLVAKALRQMKEAGAPVEALPHVVAVGKYTPYTKRLQSFLSFYGLTSSFTFLHGVGYNHLPVLYHLAAAFVYPSRIEGFGIPLLEAVTASLPAIGCTGSCLEEAGGEGCLYVHPDDAQGMADAIRRVMDDEMLRAEMIVRGQQHARRFSDEVLCRELLRVYATLL
ncbi:MAG: glycosyltransferase family 4 protein [Prevotella sp.]